MNMTSLSRTALFLLSLVCLIAFNVAPARAASEPWELTEQASLPMDLKLGDLSERLNDTPAIGFFAKLDLKHRFGLLLEDIGRYHKTGGDQVVDIEALRQRFNDILVQTLRMIEEQDPSLYEELSNAREAIWVALHSGSINE